MPISIYIKALHGQLNLKMLSKYGVIITTLKLGNNEKINSHFKLLQLLFLHCFEKLELFIDSSILCKEVILARRNRSNC